MRLYSKFSQNNIKHLLFVPVFFGFFLRGMFVLGVISVDYHAKQCRMEN